MRKESVVPLSREREGQRFVIKESLSLGRNPENDVHVDDPQASRKHAVIQQKPGGDFLVRFGQW